jgi:hypothetical protein
VVSEETNALAEGFYWHAEKLMWGYESAIPNPEEAFRFYRQAADLGFSDHDPHGRAFRTREGRCPKRQ